MLSCILDIFILFVVNTFTRIVVSAYNLYSDIFVVKNLKKKRATSLVIVFTQFLDIYSTVYPCNTYFQEERTER